YRSLWLGLHALCPDSRARDARSLAQMLSDAGMRTALLTDDSNVAEHPLASAFSERVVPGASSRPRNPDRVARGVEETDAAEFFAAACDWLESASTPFFLWLHTGTLGRSWDAPIEFRERYADEDDPAPGDWSAVPNRFLKPGFDPDELLAIT